MPLEDDKRFLDGRYRDLGILTSTPPRTFRDSRSIANESILSNSSKFVEHPKWDFRISTLQPHHKVQLHYPALNLLEEEHEEPVMYKPVNAARRYQPLPLIKDDDVWENAARDRLGEAAFSSFYRVTGEEFEEDVRCGDVFSDVREATEFYGKTVLTFVVYKTPATWALMVRVRRVSTYRLKGGEETLAGDQYDLRLDEFLHAKCEERWYEDAVDLIMGKEDLATRHVQWSLFGWMGLEKQEKVKVGAKGLFNNFRGSFKESREPDYEVYVDGLVKEVKRTSLLRLGKCKICLEPYRKPDHLPVALLCCDAPVSKECLLRLCHQWNSPSLHPPFRQPLCPRCGKSIITDPRTLEHIKYNVIADLFLDDNRYTREENFERSCADLDIEHASNSNVKIIINPTIFKTIWTRFRVLGSRKDDHVHLQLEITPEFQVAENAVFHHIDLLTGVVTTIAKLYAFLQEQIWLQFRSEFRKAGLEAYIPPGARGRSRAAEAIIKPIVYREGMKDLLARLMSRTLRAHMLRRCVCSRQSHKHGGREFYNPKDYGGKAESGRGEVLKWRESKGGRSYLKGFAEGGR